MSERQTDRQTDRQSDRQIQTDRHIDRQIDRQRRAETGDTNRERDRDERDRGIRTEHTCMLIKTHLP